MYSSSENNVEQAKNNKGTGILVTLLFIALFTIVGYGGWQLTLDGKSMNKLSEESSEEKDEFKEVDAPLSDDENEESLELPIKNDKYTFYKEIKNEIELNGNKVPLIFYYYLDNEKYKSDNINTVVDKNYYVLRREVYVSGNKVTDIDIVSMVEEENKVDSYFNDKIYNIKTFKSLDNEDYLILFLGDNNNHLLLNDSTVSLHHFAEYAYIIDSKGTDLKKITSKDPGFILQGINIKEEQFKTMNYVDYYDVLAPDENGGIITMYSVYSNSYLDVNENFVYYITGGCNGFTEYKLTIDNGVIFEEKINSYTGDSVNGTGSC